MRAWTLVAILAGCGEHETSEPYALTPERGVRAGEHADPVDAQLGPEDLADGRVEGTQAISGVQRLVAEVRGAPGTGVEGVVRLDRISGGVRLAGTVHGLPSGDVRASVHQGGDCASMQGMGPEIAASPTPEPPDPSMARPTRRLGDPPPRSPAEGLDEVQGEAARARGQASGDLLGGAGGGHTVSVQQMLEDVDLSALVGRTVVVEVRDPSAGDPKGRIAGCGVLHVADQPG